MLINSSCLKYRIYDNVKTSYSVDVSFCNFERCDGIANVLVNSQEIRFDIKINSIYKFVSSDKNSVLAESSSK